ncbi:ABC-2 family transporter protein [Acholeplasma equirhinis]|uniref:ABC transporter permease n=1 Tax=Acholeplasma equirhinis TaxID=555393 RepID=UPI00197AC690|nr:ABC-2 family transporter protein [Acholeplasma equirhinis]MBN3490425.1 ABC-2 family transporter protein [Acholeplasma equirhinis]
MKKYLKLYPIYVSRSIKARLSYRFDAFVGIFGFLIENALLFFTLYLTVGAIPSLNGWDVNMMGFLYGFYLIPKALDHILSDQVWQLSNGGIARGILDKYLIKPLNPLFQLVVEMIQLEGFGELILGIFFLIFFTPYVTITWTVSNIFALIVCVIFSMLFFFATKLTFASISFWTKRSIEVMTTIYDFSNFAKYPIQIFHQAIRFVLTYILPFSVVIFFPVEALLFGGNVWEQVLYVVIASTCMIGVSLLVWSQGIKRYESAGS